MAIVACSTPPGTGGIAVVRLSGKNSFEIASSLIKKDTKKEKPFTPYLTDLVDKDGSIFDNAIITQYEAPNSYTGENTVEFSCHGNPIIVSKIIDLCVNYGSRIAEPGEFTRKAFLNGKLDLAEAEAVSSIIYSKSLVGVKAGLSNLKGVLSKNIFSIKKSLISVVANLEFNLDISEEDLQPNIVENTVLLLEDQLKNLKTIAESYNQSDFFQSGASVVIAGPPNAGKSTLFNKILNKEHSIVTSEKGTTRDVLEKNIYIDGLPIVLKDTAGIRGGKSTAEKIGVSKSKNEILDADLVIMFNKKPKINTPENHIFVFNKSDIKKTGEKYDIKISAKNGKNVGVLKKMIYKKIVGKLSLGETMLTSKRQSLSVDSCIDSLNSAVLLLKSKESLEIVVEDINSSIKYLDQITEKTTKDDVLSVVFSSFCVGK